MREVKINLADIFGNPPKPQSPKIEPKIEEKIESTEKIYIGFYTPLSGEYIMYPVEDENLSLRDVLNLIEGGNLEYLVSRDGKGWYKGKKVDHMNFISMIKTKKFGDGKIEMLEARINNDLYYSEKTDILDEKGKTVVKRADEINAIDEVYVRDIVKKETIYIYDGKVKKKLEVKYGTVTCSRRFGGA